MIGMNFMQEQMSLSPNTFQSQQLILIVKASVNNRPRVDLSFIAKGNAKYIKLIDEMQCIKKLKGTNSKAGRIINAEIIFATDGSLEYRDE